MHPNQLHVMETPQPVVCTCWAGPVRWLGWSAIRTFGGRTPRDSQLFRPVPRPSQVPRQRRNMEALQLISDTLDVLIAKCKKLVRGWGVGVERVCVPWWLQGCRMSGLQHIREWPPSVPAVLGSPAVEGRPLACACRSVLLATKKSWRGRRLWRGLSPELHASKLLAVLLREADEECAPVWCMVTNTRLCCSSSAG